MRTLTITSLLLTVILPAASAAEPARLRPVVEAEEEVYRYEPADNGAGPLWCHGSTCLVRIGDHLFASGPKRPIQDAPARVGR